MSQCVFLYLDISLSTWWLRVCYACHSLSRDLFLCWHFSILWILERKLSHHTWLLKNCPLTCPHSAYSSSHPSLNTVHLLAFLFKYHHICIYQTTLSWVRRLVHPSQCKLFCLGLHQKPFPTLILEIVYLNLHAGDWIYIQNLVFPWSKGVVQVWPP